MIVYIGLRVVDWWSAIDGERYVGDQDQAFEDQRARESFDQGKYNWGSSLLPIYLSTHIAHMHAITLSTLATSKMIVTCIPCYLFDMRLV